ncbi:31044_t:CDS:2, partial [Racocetra persica]
MFEDDNLEELNGVFAIQIESLIIVSSEDIPKDIYFNTWDEVDNYFNEYGARNG